MRCYDCALQAYATFKAHGTFLSSVQIAEELNMPVQSVCNAVSVLAQIGSLSRRFGRPHVFLAVKDPKQIELEDEIFLRAMHRVTKGQLIQIAIPKDKPTPRPFYDAVRHHLARGMSQVTLERIYGAAAVHYVLEKVASGGGAT